MATQNITSNFENSEVNKCEIMADILENTAITPQCHYFVMRKKRLCRMTVRPGRQYCGEHEPKPKTEEGQDDTRIPCPYDAKHTCYASKLEKHLSICNAKQTDLPPYIIHNINAASDVVTCVRRPLSEIPKEKLQDVIDKVIFLYSVYVKGNIVQVPEKPIHPAVIEEFSEGDRTETSRRHMRQASSILRLAEEAGLVQDQTCYVELGAGKGQLSYYMGTAWCDALTASSVLVIDRAAMRHKRDNKLKLEGTRIRADIAHLSLGRLDRIQQAKAVVSAAKHLCGVATDLALRCVTAADVLERVSGIVLATCCHHRCEQAGYIANRQLEELGINGDELNTMLGIVSWATCGDGRSRERRRLLAQQSNNDHTDNTGQGDDNQSERDSINTQERDSNNTQERDSNNSQERDSNNTQERDSNNTQERGSNNTQERDSNNTQERDSNNTQEREERSNDTELNSNWQTEHNTSSMNGKVATIGRENNINIVLEKDSNWQGGKGTTERDSVTDNAETERDGYTSNQRSLTNPKWREEVGRRAKAVLDWGRVLYLKEKGFDAQLYHYVPATVSPENVCILATKSRKH